MIKYPCCKHFSEVCILGLCIAWKCFGRSIFRDCLSVKLKALLPEHFWSVSGVPVVKRGWKIKTVDMIAPSNQSVPFLHELHMERKWAFDHAATNRPPTWLLWLLCGWFWACTTYIHRYTYIHIHIRRNKLSMKEKGTILLFLLRTGLKKIDDFEESIKLFSTGVSVL